MSSPDQNSSSEAFSNLDAQNTSKHNKEINALEAAHVLSQGYGHVSQAVMRDRRISCEARLLYSYFSSFTGAGHTLYPSTPEILEELGWGKTKFYRARKELEALGLVSVQIKSGKDGGRYTLYRLPINVDFQKKLLELYPNAKVKTTKPKFYSGTLASNDCFPQSNEPIDNTPAQTFNDRNADRESERFPQEPKFYSGTLGSEPKFQYGKTPGRSRNTHSGTLGVRNLYIYIYIYKKYQSVSQSLQRDLQECKSENDLIDRLTDDLSEEQKKLFLDQADHLKDLFASLCRLSLKPITSLDWAETQEVWTDCLTEGYSAEAIFHAYQRYLRRYRLDNPDTTRYAKQLKNWLRDGDGLFFDCPEKLLEQHNSKPELPAWKINMYVSEAFPEFSDLFFDRKEKQEILSRKASNDDGVKALQDEIDELTVRIDDLRNQWLDSERGKAVLAGK